MHVQLSAPIVQGGAAHWHWGDKTPQNKNFINPIESNVYYY